MLSNGVPPEAFWTSQDVTHAVARFPIAPEQDTQWINNFEHHVQDMIAENPLMPESVKCALKIV